MRKNEKMAAKRGLDNIVKPKGKKFSKPVSLGMPKFKVEVICPVCAERAKDGSYLKARAKESASAPMCKSCKSKQV